MMRLSRLASIAFLLIPVVVFAQHSSSAGASASSGLSSASLAASSSSSGGPHATPNSAARSAEDSFASNTTAVQTDNKEPGKTVHADHKKPQKPASDVAANRACIPTPACPSGSFGADGRCVSGMAPSTNECPGGQLWDGTQCRVPINNCVSTTASLKSGTHK
jgi:preprotein translocase subunit SecG